MDYEGYGEMEPCIRLTLRLISGPNWPSSVSVVDVEIFVKVMIIDMEWFDEYVGVPIIVNEISI